MELNLGCCPNPKGRELLRGDDGICDYEKPSLKESVKEKEQKSEMGPGTGC